MTERFDQCSPDCTVDCGHCKGQGRPGDFGRVRERIAAALWERNPGAGCAGMSWADLVAAEGDDWRRLFVQQIRGDADAVLDAVAEEAARLRQDALNALNAFDIYREDDDNEPFDRAMETLGGASEEATDV